MYKSNPLWIIRTDYNWAEYNREQYERETRRGLPPAKAAIGLPSDGYRFFSGECGEAPILQLEKEVRRFTKLDILPCIELVAQGVGGGPNILLHIPYIGISPCTAGNISAEDVRKYINLNEDVVNDFTRKRLPVGTKKVRVIIDYVSNTGFFRPIFYELNDEFDVTRIDALGNEKAKINSDWNS